MLAFLKRRWFLFTCAALLVTCSMVDWHVSLSSQTSQCLVGVEKGNVWFVHAPRNGEEPLGWDGDTLHAPKFGRGPSHIWEVSLKWVQFPLWFPLSAVIGWIIFLELRRRKK